MREACSTELGASYELDNERARPFLLFSTEIIYRFISLPSFPYCEEQARVPLLSFAFPRISRMVTENFVQTHRSIIKIIPSNFNL